MIFSLHDDGQYETAQTRFILLFTPIHQNVFIKKMSKYIETSSYSLVHQALELKSNSECLR